MSPSTTKRTLSTAEERREVLVEAAVRVFARRGFHATPTTEIAHAAGISQAYLFRLFPTKTELFVAAVDRGCERMLAAFRQSARNAPEGDRLAAMGKAYAELVESDRDVLQIQLHSQVAAAADPAIRDAGRRCFSALFDLVSRESGASDAELQAWFAQGMLINVMTSIGAETVDERWARVLTMEGDGQC